MKIGLLWIIFLIVLTSVCDTLGQLCLKSSINSLESDVSGLKKIIRFVLKIIILPKAWLAFIFSCLSLGLWLFVLSKADLSFAFSIDSMHYIFIAWASQTILKEKVGFRRWVGTLLIMTGIAIVGFTGQS